MKNRGGGSLREAELLKQREDETIHVVERRWDTGEINEASSMWREGMSTIIKQGRVHSLQQHASNRKQGTKTA